MNTMRFLLASSLVVSINMVAAQLTVSTMSDMQGEVAGFQQRYEQLRDNSGARDFGQQSHQLSIDVEKFQENDLEPQFASAVGTDVTRFSIMSGSLKQITLGLKALKKEVDQKTYEQLKQRAVKRLKSEQQQFKDIMSQQISQDDRWKKLDDLQFRLPSQYQSHYEHPELQHGDDHAKACAQLYGEIEAAMKASKTVTVLPTHTPPISQEIIDAVRKGTATRIKHEVVSGREKFEALEVESTMSAHERYMSAKALYNTLPPKPAVIRNPLDEEIIDLRTHVETFMAKKAREALQDFEKQGDSNERQLEELANQPVDRTRHLKHIELIKKELEIAAAMREYNPSLPTDKCDRLRALLSELERSLKELDETPPLRTRRASVDSGDSEPSSPLRMDREIHAMILTDEQVKELKDIEDKLDDIEIDDLPGMKMNSLAQETVEGCPLTITYVKERKTKLEAAGYKNCQKAKELLKQADRLLKELNVVQKRINNVQRVRIGKYVVGGVVGVTALAVLAYFWFKRPAIAA